jgi:hypothetical protein
MNELLLATAAPHIPVAPQNTPTGSMITTLIAVGFYAFLYALVIICLIRIVRYLGTAGKEQKLIRFELGKVAEEVHLLRQELKGEKGNSSPTVS